MGINSYAQNFEDVLLWRALSHVERGLYIDIGAQHPVIDSVSLAFYERGWRGIHIEPVFQYAESLRQQRVGDIVLQAAVGKGPSVISFFEIPDTGLSTADAVIAARHKSSGFGVREISVPCIPLAAVFDRAEGQDIHWLKIDVEGFETEVLGSWAPSAARPWIVVIESTLPLTQIESYQAWEHILLELGYTLAYFDGLNRFYVSSAHDELKKSLSVPPNTFDDFTLNGTANAPFHRAIQARDALQIQAVETQLNSLKREIESDRATYAAREDSLSRDIDHWKVLLSSQEAEFAAKMTSARSEALQEWKEQEMRHAAARSALELELGLLRGRIGELEAGGVRREKEFLEQLQQEAEYARIRAQALVEKLAALQTAHLQHVATLESHARMERQEAALQHNDLRLQMNVRLARERNLAEAFAVTRSEIAALKSTWAWRLFFGKKQFGSAISAEKVGLPVNAPNESGGICSTPQAPYMNENHDAIKPARSVDELLKFNDYDFVQCAYLSILERPADAEGLANYVQHVRAGADRLELIHALATSPEGALRDSARLPGLSEVMRHLDRNRPSFISRRIVGPIRRALRPLFARMDVCEYRINKLEELVQIRLDAMDQRIKSTMQNRVSIGAVSAEEKTATDKLTAHARAIYFQLKDREKAATGNPMS